MKINRIHLLSVLVLTTAVLALFLPGLSFERSIFDDHMYIGREFNLALTQENLVQQFSNKTVGLNSPLVVYSFMLDRAVWGEALLDQGCRVQNIFWHLIAVIFLYFTLCRLYFRREDGEKLYLAPAAALFAALGTAIHPQRLESVIWISERKDVLVMALGMMSLFFFIRAWEKRRISVAAVLLFLLSFGAKPMLITLPLILLTGMWAAERRFDWKLFLKFLSPFLAVAALYFMVNFAVMSSFAGGAAANLFEPAQLLLTCRNYVLYFWRTLYPVPLTPFYPLFVAGSRSYLYPAGVLAVWAAVITLSVAKWRYRDVCCYIFLPLLLMYSFAAAPIVGLKVVGNADFADRYSYLPGIAVWIMLAASALLAAERFYGKRRLIIALCGLYLLFLLANTIFYYPSWRTKEAMINRIVAVSPGDPAGLTLLSADAYRQGRLMDAAAYVMQFETREKRYLLFQHAMRAMVLIRCGNADEGMKILHKVFMDKKWYELRYAPDGFVREVMTTAAGYYIQNRHVPGNLQYAVNLFNMLALLRDGVDPVESFNYRAVAMIIEKRFAEAEKLLLHALKLNPGDRNLLKNLESVRRELYSAPKSRPAAE